MAHMPLNYFGLLTVISSPSPMDLFAYRHGSPLSEMFYQLDPRQSTASSLKLKQVTRLPPLTLLS
ncbi:hypothetical protein DVH05_003717 [Phytophthora capsici]|nr:hypothetical protein DVH05_003717 [Phytophthora capsici]